MKQRQHNELTIVGRQPTRRCHDLTSERIVGLADVNTFGSTSRARGKHHCSTIANIERWPIGELLGSEHGQFAIIFVNRNHRY